jgi:branched-chain amino acid transport system ATP-binding protein
MSAATQPLLRLTDVCKVFGGVHALSQISCEVPVGKIVGVIGPNGAGKTTMFNVITGAFPADAGSIVLNGDPITRLPAHRIVRAGISRTFQNIRLFGEMTVWEHLLVAPRGSSRLRRFLPIAFADRDEIAHAEGVLKFFGLDEVRDRVARGLPYGLQRKVEMARALTAAPQLLLLDEPVAGMNHDEADEVRKLMLSLRDEGTSILLIEHDMAFVMNLCDYLYVLDFGVIIAEGRPDEVRANPVVLDAYLGRAA